MLGGLRSLEGCLYFSFVVTRYHFDNTSPYMLLFTDGDGKNNWHKCIITVPCISKHEENDWVPILLLSVQNNKQEQCRIYVYCFRLHVSKYYIHGTRNIISKLFSGSSIVRILGYALFYSIQVQIIETHVVFKCGDNIW